MKISYGILLFSTIILASCSSNTLSDSQTDNEISGEPENLNEQNISNPDSMPEDAENIEARNDNDNQAYTQDGNSYTFTTNSEVSVTVHPISHATMVINWDTTTMYVDPAEALESYSEYDDPNIVLVTHEHGDHFNLEVLEALVQDNVELIVNDAVYQKLTPELQEKAIVMENGDTSELLGFQIRAIPAYNVREEASNYHPKGRDNGYLIEQDSFRVYISGDSEDTPEMRALQDIDLAFVSMNLPYTMPIDSAINGVGEFAPKTVFPYHFRGEDGMSDVEKFETELEGRNSQIDVVLANWYE